MRVSFSHENGTKLNLLMQVFLTPYRDAEKSHQSGDFLKDFSWNELFDKKMNDQEGKF